MDVVPGELLAALEEQWPGEQKLKEDKVWHAYLVHEGIVP